MQLSILIGTNRPSLLACSRIAQACSWAGPNVEVIVRDNSGDARKRALLSQFHQDNCKIIIAEPCDALTNASEILKLAKGDFVFLLADDDFGFDHGVAFAWCRLFYLYGEGEDSRRLVSYVRARLQAGEPAELSSGSQVRDFLDVREAARMPVPTAKKATAAPRN